MKKCPHSIDINKLHQFELIPGFKARFVYTENVTISYWEVKKGSQLPEHHHHEQLSQVAEGTFHLTIDGWLNIMEEGKVAIIPSNAVHSGQAITDCRIMDIFNPVREDYKF